VGSVAVLAEAVVPDGDFDSAAAVLAAPSRAGSER